MDMTPQTQPDLATADAASARPLDLAIILPTLNERDNLAPLVERIEGALGKSGWEVLIVDDNSSDGTSDEARRLSLSDPRVRVIQRIGRRGLSSAAIEGFCATAAPYVAVMDADHQHDPKLLVDMLASVKSGEAEVAVASRFAEGASMEEWGRPDREKLSSVANFLARKLTGGRIERPDERFLPAADRDRAAPGAQPVGNRLQDPARPAGHFRHTAQGEGFSDELLRPPLRRIEARPRDRARFPRRPLRQELRADHPDAIRAVRHGRRARHPRPHGHSLRFPVGRGHEFQLEPGGSRPSGR